MNKPKFDPNKPFEKAAFDPNAEWTIPGEIQKAAQTGFQKLHEAGNAPGRAGMSARSLEAALKTALEGLGIGGNIARGGVQNVVDMLTGQAPQYDISKGYKSPEFSDYMKERGVGEMGSANIPGFGRVTGRGFLGGAGDVLVDPLSLTGAGATKKALAPVADVVEAGAKNIYKNSAMMEALDQVARRAAHSTGKTVQEFPSQILYESNKWGTSAGLEPQIWDVMAKEGRVADKVMTELEGMGVRPNYNRAMQPFEEYTQGLVSSKIPLEQQKGKVLQEINPVRFDAQGNPLPEPLSPDWYKLAQPRPASQVTIKKSVPTGELIPEGYEMKPVFKEVEEVRNIPEVVGNSPVDLLGQKRSLYEATPTSAWEGKGVDLTGFSRAKMKMAQALREETEALARENLGAESVDKLIRSNRRYGALADVLEKAASEAGKTISSKKAITGPMTMLSTIYNPIAGGGKLLGQALPSSWFRTGTGIAGKKLAQGIRSDRAAQLLTPAIVDYFQQKRKEAEEL